MHWFQADAPIRLKMKIVVGTFVGLIAALGLVSYLVDGSNVALGVSGVFVVIGTLVGAWFRKAVCDPYVTTVVRMEGVAAGDLASPVQFTDHKDCVGRLTRAMLTFRDAAVQQQGQAASQNDVVGTLKSHLRLLAKGDLTAEITADFPPAYAELKANFNEALIELRTLIGSVMESTASIGTGSGEIAHASENLARRTEANAASLEETSAALSQIDDRLKATAIAAGNTVQRADQAIATVGGGRAVAEEAVQAMGRVSDSARGIDSVIEGVDKIAFQTRVLAMNAAVEAGRAGDAGRGFAVVADLVSALAMRAEEEAKRARDQLTVTQADIVTAVEAVQKVDGALANISGDVGEVHQLLGTMAADNKAQSSAISEISTAIGTMDQSTQQNAAMVQETSAAARNLNGEVNALTERAAQFRVDGIRTAPRAQRPAGAATLDQRLAAPTRPLPAAAVPALVRSEGNEDWNEF
jgi:methyl-accepting chemotaxis protein